MAPGRTVLQPGRALRPQDLGLLASLGVGAVPVVRRPRVDVLITGDELLPVGSLLPDRRELVRDALRDSPADVLLVSGGSSVGQEDHAPAVLAELGELAVHGVALRPASPTGVGFLKSVSGGGRPVFLLPGNPVS